MKSITWFVVIAVVFEAVALIVNIGGYVTWLLDALLTLAGLYVLFLAVRGWRKQLHSDLPPVMKGTIVRKRHWNFF